MKKLIILVFALLFMVVGCNSSNNKKSDEEKFIDFIQTKTNLALVEVIERKSVSNSNSNGYGYEYKVKDQEGNVSNWIFSTNLFSISEIVLVIEIQDNVLILIDIS